MELPPGGPRGGGGIHGFGCFVAGSLAVFGLGKRNGGGRRDGEVGILNGTVAYRVISNRRLCSKRIIREGIG